MAIVLDQFEVEPTSLYESGSYDQTVMGNMLSVSYPGGGVVKYTPGSRGVVFGSVNSRLVEDPGTSEYDYTRMASYRAQPYREKAGNVRAAKHFCYSERIFDTLTPDPIQCFEKNGASVFLMPPTDAPGVEEQYSGVTNDCAFIIFDLYMPDTTSFPHREGVDRVWTKSFPFEPRYSSLPRLKKQSFEVEVSKIANFRTRKFSGGRTTKTKGLIVGTVGPEVVSEHGKTLSDAAQWVHRWAIDITIPPPMFIIPTVPTGSMSNSDTMKVLFGFGDTNTAFFTSSYGDVVMGTNKWPTFRRNGPTHFYTSPPPGTYYEEDITGSYWSASPVLRGWKYGLHSALPSYSSAYFRQGKFGQFRDMLEQRQYTKVTSDIPIVAASILGKSFSYSDTTEEAVVTVKFLDSDGNLTPPENTQSQNLSFEVTSSLPYFDLTARSRAENNISNMKLIDLKVDSTGKVML